MMSLLCRKLLGLAVLLMSAPAFAGISVSPLTIDLSQDRSYADFTVQNIGNDIDYVSVVLGQVSHPGQSLSFNETLFDPRKAGILVTPNKLVLPVQGSRLVRVQLTQAPSDVDKVYTVTFAPVNSQEFGVDQEQKDTVSAHVDVTFAFAAMVIVRPLHPHAELVVARDKNTVIVTNNGNTAAQIVNLKYCNKQGKDCLKLSNILIYAGATRKIDLEGDGNLNYDIEYYQQKNETNHVV